MTGSVLNKLTKRALNNDQFIWSFSISLVEEWMDGGVAVGVQGSLIITSSFDFT